MTKAVDMRRGFLRGYRSEIDGLRALAVIPVLLFHAGFQTFSGGFVGVDIFFVISGYLIASVISKEISEDRFSFGRFFERRIRRIFPALAFVVLACIPFSWRLMTPAEIVAFSSSTMSVFLFLSNLLFWRQSGYFDVGSEFKPLLHTWSLGVEGQFYVTFPVIFVLLQKFSRSYVLIWILLGGAFSLCLSQYASIYHSEFNFFWLPTRAWELLFGAACAFATIRPNSYLGNFLSGIGILLVVFSIFYLDESAQVRSTQMLIPVTGACLIILFGTAGSVVGNILSMRPVVSIGLMSYSAYLWHQPMFVFARLFPGLDFNNTTRAVLLVALLPLSYISWRYIETPFRESAISLRRMFSVIFPLVALAVGCSIFGYTTKGYLWREEDPTVTQARFRSFFDDSSLKFEIREGIREGFHDECNFMDVQGFIESGEHRMRQDPLSESCYQRDTQFAHAVFIWGDSHAQMLRYGLQETIPETWQVLQVATSSCPPSILSDKVLCSTANSFAMTAIERAKPDVVIVARRRGHNLKSMDEIYDALIALGVNRVIFTGTAPIWKHSLPDVLLDFWPNLPRRTWAGVEVEVLENDRKLKELSMSMNSRRYLSLIDLLCNLEGCVTYIGNDAARGITTFDYGHLTPVASAFVAKNGLLEAVMSGAR